jgi:hypothetical protein
MQWQVVQAQTPPQALSISIWWAWASSRIEVPGSASTTMPSGQNLSWGRKITCGIR